MTIKKLIPYNGSNQIQLIEKYSEISFPSWNWLTNRRNMNPTEVSTTADRWSHVDDFHTALTACSPNVKSSKTWQHLRQWHLKLFVYVILVRTNFSYSPSSKSQINKRTNENLGRFIIISFLFSSSHIRSATQIRNNRCDSFNSIDLEFVWTGVWPIEFVIS